MDLEKAKKDPSSQFEDPEQVLALKVANEDKIAILKQWEYDVRELLVAEEENMDLADNKVNAPADLGELLRNIRKALDKLRSSDSSEANNPAESAPTKQG